MATMSMDVDNIHGLGLPAAQGAMYVVGFYADLDDDTRAFAKRYRDKMGRSPGFIPAGVYSAVRHYLKAIEAAGTDDSKKVIAKMREMPINDGFAKGGKLREDGRMVHDMYLVAGQDARQIQGCVGLSEAREGHSGRRRFPADDAGRMHLSEEVGVLPRLPRLRPGGFSCSPARRRCSANV